MKMWEIALFIFILNMTIGLMNILAFTEEYATSTDESRIMDISSAEEKISSTVGEEQGGIVGTVNMFAESVRLAIQGIGSLISLLLNSTIFSYNTYYKFLCYGGVSCEVGSFMWTFAGGLSSLTYVVYTVALIQLATGKSLPTME